MDVIIFMLGSKYKMFILIYALEKNIQARSTTQPQLTVDRDWTTVAIDNSRSAGAQTVTGTQPTEMRGSEEHYSVIKV